MVKKMKRQAIPTPTAIARKKSTAEGVFPTNVDVLPGSPVPVEVAVGKPLVTLDRMDVPVMPGIPVDAGGGGTVDMENQVRAVLSRNRNVRISLMRTHEGTVVALLRCCSCL